MNCSQPRIPRRVMAPFVAFAIGLTGLALVANQPEPAPASAVTASAPITADRTAVIEYDSPTVQAWTPDQAPQVDPLPVGAPGADTPVTSGVGCQEDNPCWDCETMGNKDCGPADTVTEPVCEEDMPCWDCETMGNQVCGTIDDAGEAWRVWDEVGASRGVSDGSFRVEYMGSTPEYPENLTPGDIPLLGTDGTWYVFHATDDLPANL